MNFVNLEHVCFSRPVTEQPEMSRRRTFADPIKDVPVQWRDEANETPHATLGHKAKGKKSKVFHDTKESPVS